MEPMVGLEPTTTALRKRCSTTELHRQNTITKQGAIYLSPVMRRGKPEKKVRKSVVKRKVQVWVSAEMADGGRRFLLLKLNSKRGGFWQPVTGGVERGEVVAEAARRESEEETSLPFASDPVAVGYEFKFKKKGKAFHEVVFRREVSWDRRDELKLDPREHVEAEWVEADEAFSRLKFDSNRAGLRAAIASLSSD